MLNIYADPGTKVKYDRPNAGLPGDHELAKERHLSRRKHYTVERTDVVRFHTDLYLKEVPGVAFNEAIFTEVKKKRKRKAR
jgi:hypothetical protein